jgi:hypothetical protein
MVMAAYKYPDFIRQVYNYSFDIAAGPGKPAQNSGIYRCDGCGIVSGYGNPCRPKAIININRARGTSGGG